jgi:hypothetical protein
MAQIAHFPSFASFEDAHSATLRLGCKVRARWREANLAIAKPKRANLRS